MNKALNIYMNEVYTKYLNCDKRTQIFFGGSSSGKSYFLAQRCILDIIKGGRNYLICRAVARTLKKSVFNEVQKAINLMGFAKYFKVNQTDLTITCINGYQILFAGLDDSEKIKSITPIFGVITDIWIEEATECSYKAYKQLNKRLRGIVDVNKRMTLSFNPIYKTHWIYNEFFLLWDDTKTVFENNKLLILKTTYKDNNFLSQDDIDELENETDKYYYEVYTLGNWGMLGNVIFKNWTTEDLSKKLDTFGLIESGLDFGFTDPNAYIQCHYNKNRKTLYIIRQLYQSDMTNDELESEIKKIYENELILADSAEPQSIKTLFRTGLKIKGCKKGKGSVEFGYKWLLQQKIVVDINCVDVIRELTIHKYKEDKDGNPMNFPEDRNNHAIDAIRYAMQYQMQNSVGAGIY